MAAKKIKLQEETISEILVADTGSESGTEASDGGGGGGENEGGGGGGGVEEEEKQQQQAPAEVGGQVAASGRLPTWAPPQGTQISVLLSVQQKV